MSAMVTTVHEVHVFFHLVHSEITLDRGPALATM